MNDQSPIEKEPPLQFAVEATVTALFWGLWLYVIAPMISVLMWLAGVQIFVEQMITLGGYEYFLDKLTDYGLVVLGIMCTTFGWVLWNLKRYGKRNTRRREPVPVSAQETAAVAGLRPEAVRRLQRQRRLVIDFDERNHVVPADQYVPRRRRRA